MAPKVSKKTAASTAAVKKKPAAATAAAVKAVVNKNAVGDVYADLVGKNRTVIECLGKKLRVTETRFGTLTVWHIDNDCWEATSGNETSVAFVSMPPPKKRPSN